MKDCMGVSGSEGLERWRVYAEQIRRWSEEQEVRVACLALCVCVAGCASAKESKLYANLGLRVWVLLWFFFKRVFSQCQANIKKMWLVKKRTYKAVFCWSPNSVTGVCSLGLSVPNSCPVAKGVDPLKLLSLPPWFGAMHSKVRDSQDPPLRLALWTLT